MSPKLLNLLLIVGSVAVYYLLINPLYGGVGTVWSPERGIKDLRNRNQEYDKTLEQAEQLYKEAEKLKQDYSAIDEETKKKIEVMVPKNVDPVKLLSEINTIANETGVPLDDISYSQNTVTSFDRGSYAVQIGVKTTYPKFKQLMDNYEKSLRIFNIDSTVFAVTDKPNELIDYQVKLNTYYIK